MPCSIANCSVKVDTERALVCWLCENFAHIKCAKLNGKVADVIEDRNSGIHWYCHLCRNVNSGICALFRETRLAFNGMSKDIDALQKKLREYENLFKNYRLDIHDSDRKKKNVPQSLSIPTLSINNDETNLITLSLTCSNTTVISSEPSSIPPEQNVVCSEENESMNLRSAVNKFNVANQAAKSKTIPSLSSGKKTNVSSDKSPVKLPPNSSRKTSLKVVVPMKNIFVSRFSSDTTEENILDYILESFPNLKSTELKVRKFNFSYNRYYSSFKISVPPSLFNSVVNSQFWPQGVIVHEFKFKEKQPQISLAATKSTLNEDAYFFFIISLFIASFFFNKKLTISLKILNLTKILSPNQGA